MQCYNTSGGFLHTPLDQVLKNVIISRENGIGGIKIKVGQPDTKEDIRRLTAVREALGDDFPVDGGRQPAMGPRNRYPHGPPDGEIQPDLD